MCTAITYQTIDHYFGRNLDLEYNYHESVVITPRCYPFHFRKLTQLSVHYAMIGIATVANEYPLYYDATNEFGLSVAGLNFPGNAVYKKENPDADNITAFEFIPWILGQCKSVAEARQKLKQINMINIPFSEEFPLSPLHWLISDRYGSITVEPLPDGLKVYENPIGVLTNNPPFDFHMHHLCNYLNLTHEEPTNRFAQQIDLTPYSRGMGAIGLPGDLSSSSRFIRAAFTKLNAKSGSTENESVSQFFHILGSVEQQRGCVQVDDAFELTVYASCCNTDKGIYYYKTYENSRITAVYLFHEDLNSCKLITYPLRTAQEIEKEN